MTSTSSAILNQLTDNRGDYVSFCRFLSNPKITHDKLVTGVLSNTAELVKGKEVLVLNDTTELNYQHHFNYYSEADSDLGPTGNDRDLGFFLHPGYVIDNSTGIGLGFSYINIWNRDKNKLDKYQRGYKELPIEEKESYRWLECGHEAKKQLSGAKHITLIADRESDIYDEFVKVPDDKTDLIIRSCRDSLANC